MSKVYREGEYELADNIYMHTGGPIEEADTTTGDLSNSAHRPVKAPAAPSAKGDLRPKIAIYQGGSNLTSEDVNVYEIPELAERRKSEKQNNSGFQLNQIASFKCANVCLGVLCVLLLAGIIVLGVLYAIKSTEVANAQTQSTTLQYERDVLLNIAAQELGWTRFGSSLYFHSTRFNFTPSTWTTSREDCSRRNAQLVIINSQAELNFLSTYHTTSPFWIGATAINKVWTWVDGTLVKTTYWANSQPGSSTCAIQNPQFIVTKSWTGANCSGAQNWICERVVFPLE